MPPKHSLLALAALLSACLSLLSGCGPKGGPGGAAPGDRGTAGSDSGQPTVTEVSQIDTTRSSQFRIRTELRSLVVVEYFNEQLEARGWKKKRPKLAELPGHREWFSMGTTIGPTEVYDAAWENPQTGEVGVLRLWHTAEHPDIQVGEFEITSGEQVPL